MRHDAEQGTRAPFPHSMSHVATPPRPTFLLSVRPEALGEVLTRFASRDIACQVVGEVDDSRTLMLKQGDARQLLWDLNTDAFIGEARHAWPRLSFQPVRCVTTQRSVPAARVMQRLLNDGGMIALPSLQPYSPRLLR